MAVTAFFVPQTYGKSRWTSLTHLAKAMVKNRRKEMVGMLNKARQEEHREGERNNKRKERGK